MTQARLLSQRTPSHAPHCSPLPVLGALVNSPGLSHPRAFGLAPSHPFNPSSNIIVKKSIPSASFLKHPFLGFLTIRTQRFHCGALCPIPDEGTNTLKPCGTARKHHCSPRLCISLPVRSQPQPAGTVLADALMCSQRDSSTRRSTCEWEAGTAL